MKILVLLGRLLYAWIFLTSLPAHFSQQMMGVAGMHGVPMPSLMVPLSGMIAFLGALSILVGYKARFGAWLIIIFLVPVTLVMHQWWTVTDAGARQMQEVMFNKNLAMIGAALMIAYFGSGPLSIDNTKRRNMKYIWAFPKTIKAHEGLILGGLQWYENKVYKKLSLIFNLNKLSIKSDEFVNQNVRPAV